MHLIPDDGKPKYDHTGRIEIKSMFFLTGEEPGNCTPALSVSDEVWCMYDKPMTLLVGGKLYKHAMSKPLHNEQVYVTG